MIPKVFHSIWLGPDPLPAEFEPYQESWRQHHPGWELQLWTEDNLPSELRRAEVYEKERQPVERADILRLELIWRFGGVYIDTDFECLKSIDELLEGVEFFTGMMKPAGRSKPARVNNAIFGAVPGHPLLDRALDELQVHELGARYDKHLSGAMFFNALVLGSPDVKVFPIDFFYPTTELGREQAYGIHHAARLWHDVEGLRIIMRRAETRLEKTTQRLEKEQFLRERDQRLHEEAVRKLEEEKRALEERLEAEQRALQERLEAEQRALQERLEAEQRAREEELEAQKRALEERLGTLEQERAHGLKILFFLRSIHFDRMFEPLLRALLERGHVLHVVLSIEKRGLGESKARLFEEFRERYAFTYEQLPPRNEPWLRTAVALRTALDYLRYLEPEFAHADPLRERARSRSPVLVRMLLAFPFRGRLGRRALAALLRTLERAIPVPRSIKDLVKARKPDVVLVSPLVGMGSTESEFIRAAEGLGIPTVLPVASWDNLTNKGVLRDVPTTTIVWNDVQVDEAVQLHKLPRERVVAVGAHSFDHWFGWSPSTTHEEFARTRRLDPERPLLVYLGSSYFISGDETAFIREWLARVRAHPALADVAVIMRPHPQNGVGWDELEDDPGRTVVWPRIPTAPTDDEKRADYFDTLSHASAIVAINTTGMVEAAILHRPIFTLISEHFTTQEGTLHFSYVAGEREQGPVTVARSWEEHLDQLARAVKAPTVDADRFDAFVRSFVRPRGLGTAAAPAAADAVERAAATTVTRRRVSLLRPLLVVLTPLAMLSTWVAGSRRAWQKRTKAKAGNRWTAPRGRREDRMRAATDVWREREERLEAKHEAKAIQRAERQREREEKHQSRVEKRRELAAAAEPPERQARRAEKQQMRISKAEGRQEAKAAKAAEAPAANDTERQARREQKEQARISKVQTRQEAKAARAAEQQPPAQDDGERQARREQKEQERAAKAQNRDEATMTNAVEPTPPAEDDGERQARRDQKEQERAAKAQTREEANAAKVAAAELSTAEAARDPEKQQRREEKVARAKAKETTKAAARASKRRRALGRGTRRRWKGLKRGVRSAYNVRYRFTYRSSLARVPSRDEIPVMLNARGLTGRGAEIGVRDGRFSDHLLETWKCDLLISIDPWFPADPDEYVDRSNVSLEEHERLYLETQARLAHHGARSDIWRMTSIEAAPLIPDGSLDFAYIDARHDYESVLEDLATWFPKIKPGGILAGHDYADIDFKENVFGVKSAVDEFFEARGLTVYCTDGPSAVELFPSWIVEIPVHGDADHNGGRAGVVAATDSGDHQR